MFGLDEMSSGIVRFTEEAVSQAPKMLANTHHDVVLEYRKEQRKREWNSRILCSVGEHTLFLFFERVKCMLLKTAVRSKTDTNYQSTEFEMHKIQRTKGIP